MAEAQSGTLETLTEVKDSRHRVFSPTVGYYSYWPRSGTFLTGGSVIGKLKVLNTYYDLVLPENVYGRVVTDDEKDFIIPVGHGQELFQLNPDKNLLETETPLKDGSGAEGEEFDVSSDEGYLVKAFTTGIFYAKPSPDAPSFVTVGQEIEKGKALGLIEVMKTFNHIIFQGTGDSTTGKIKKVYVKDAQEVKLGQPLFLIE